jgi:hypothetical protein|tara:strand:+ start:1090 stop:1674 length:585 start_codon:yes stop_codon:yes gene_type:complete
MANVDAPNGAKPVRHLTGGVIRAREWKIIGDGNASSNIFTGDFVKLQSSGYITVAGAGDRLLGVFAGCKYTASDGTPKFAKYWPASTTTLGSADVTAYVYDDPNIVFAIQGDGTDAFTQVGNLANIVVTAGSTTTGQSKMELDTDNIGTGTANLRILGITDDPKNSWGANTEQEVLIHEHELNQHIDADGTVGV